VRKLCRLPSPVVSDCIPAIRQGGNQPIAMAAIASRSVCASILAALPQKRPRTGPPLISSRSSRLAVRLEKAALDMDSSSGFTACASYRCKPVAALTEEGK
jgi:hypothetical protein